MTKKDLEMVRKVASIIKGSTMSPSDEFSGGVDALLNGIETMLSVRSKRVEVRVKKVTKKRKQKQIEEDDESSKGNDEA